MKKGNIILSVFFILILSIGCKSKYQKLLDSTDLDKKYAKAIAYYEDEKYFKALPLLEELTSVYRGTDKGEKINYTFAYCNYGLGDLLSASYYFKQFAKTYPKSTYTEECLYMTAYCNYQLSPKYSLDQSATYQAIEAYQLFINRFPYSERVKECNTQIDELRDKLELKSFENAKLYVTISDFKSAIIALDNASEDFPDSEYREEMEFLRVKSQFLYSKNSIRAKQVERYQKTTLLYEEFVDLYPESEYLREAEQYYVDANKEISSSATIK